MSDEMMIGLYIVFLLCAAAFIWLCTAKRRLYRLVQDELMAAYRRDYPAVSAWMDANGPPEVMRSMVLIQLQLEKLKLLGKHHEGCVMTAARPQAGEGGGG